MFFGVREFISINFLNVTALTTPIGVISELMGLCRIK
jgi:hypothetical protein